MIFKVQQKNNQNKFQPCFLIGIFQFPLFYKMFELFLLIFLRRLLRLFSAQKLADVNQDLANDLELVFTIFLKKFKIYFKSKPL